MLKTAKTTVLLINLGTPDSPSVADVRKYLREFLMDPRVMDIPFINRFLLVQLLIAPTRAPQSAKVYQDLWQKEGSPLKIHGQGLTRLLQGALGSDYSVHLAMRYQNPSIASVLDEIKKENPQKIIVIPLYPQYASASTGSTIEEFFRQMKSWETIPQLHIVSQFCDDPLFIKAFAQVGKEYMDREQYDHFIFSYHGLPERQVLKASHQNYCQLSEKCCSVYHAKNQFCYRAQCHETTRLLARELGIPSDRYTVCFQSRLGKTPWIKPYTDEILKDLPGKGIKKVLAFSPSFVADCLETTIEIGVEYAKLFKEHGGERWQLVESLNTHPLWVESLKQMVLNAKALDKMANLATTSKI